MYIYSISHTHKHTTSSSSLSLGKLSNYLSIYISIRYFFISIFQTPSTKTKKKQKERVHRMKYNNSRYIPETLMHDIPYQNHERTVPVFQGRIPLSLDSLNLQNVHQDFVWHKAQGGHHDLRMVSKEIWDVLG